MKSRLSLILAVALSALIVPVALADQRHLRYEWASTAAGPFTPVPREMIKVHTDGTATVVTTEPRIFFRLLFDDGTGAGGGASVPIRPLNSLPAPTLAMVNRLIIAVARDGSVEGADWTGASIAPFVTPVTSAWNNTGEPDLVELKIVGRCEAVAPGALFANTEGARRSTDRGFILASLSRKSPPIVGYATAGPTQCESLLSNCQGMPVHLIRRFGPMFLAAEDAGGNLLGNEGLFPALYSDQTYLDLMRPISYSWDSENPNNPRLPVAPAPATPRTFSSYRELLDAYAIIPCIKERREQREALIEFDWLAMEGRAPTLAAKVGEERLFLEGETFTRFSLDDEEGRGAMVTVARGVPGVTIRGLIAGAWRLTLFSVTGVPQRYLIVVSPSGPVPRGGATGTFTTSKLWEAGAEENQPRYSQRADLERWCSAVGCGPTMIAIQIAWAEHNQNVPSAYWYRHPNATLAARRESLRDIESPMIYSTNSPAGSMLFWYDYLHDACDVACWVNGSGSTLPWDLGDAMADYVDYACSSLMPLEVANDTGGPLVGGSWDWENDSWGNGVSVQILTKSCAAAVLQPGLSKNAYRPHFPS